MRSLGIAIGACLLVATSAFAAVESPVNGFARSPVLGSAANSNTNYMERTLIWPATSEMDGNTFSFDYVVDSQYGHDFLKVYVNGVEKDLDPYTSHTGISGLNRAGRKLVVVPSAGGALTIRFAYVKNGSMTHGRDLAIIDNVQFSSAASGGTFARDRFDSDASLAGLGWTVGGHDGGFIKGRAERERAASRPPAQAYVSNSTSYMERSVTFPSCLTCGVYRGSIEFDYYVDSNVNHAWLRVYADGVEQDLDASEPGTQGVSGRNRSGSHRVRVTSAGLHAIRFAYAKDGSASTGRDTARVDQVRLVNGDGRMFEFHDFTGRDLDTSPIRSTVSGSTTVPDEWMGGSTGLGNDALGWVVRPESPPVAYVPLQTVGEKYGPTYRAFSLPAAGIVTGVVTKADYDNDTVAHILDFKSHTVSSRLRMVAEAGEGSLYVGFVGNATTPAQLGDESATIYLHLDGKRAYSLRDRDTAGSGACADVGRPGPEDRYLKLSYDIPAGSRDPVTPSRIETKGDCSGWVSLAGSPSWLSAVKVSEPVPGTVHAEIKLTFPAESSVIADGLLGLAIRHYKRVVGVGVLVDERWPDGSYGPPPDEVHSWATVALSVPSLAKYFAKAENPFRSLLTPSRDPYRFRGTR